LVARTSAVVGMESLVFELICYLLSVMLYCARIFASVGLSWVMLWMSADSVNTLKVITFVTVGIQYLFIHVILVLFKFIADWSKS